MDCFFDRSLAEKYKNKSQQTRIMAETWISKNIRCLRCWDGVLVHLPQNKPLADFICVPCGDQYELKSMRGRIRRKILGGSYEKCVDRIMSNDNPDWLVMCYDEKDLCVNDLWFIPKHFFVPSIVEPRKPLSANARRSGWTGCNILFDKIPVQGKIPIVCSRELVAKSEIKAKVEVASRLCIKDMGARSWLSDVLECVNSIQKPTFTIEEMYAFETVLKARHPNNNNVKAKIRQQLQFLRDKGLIEFLGPRNYAKKV